MTEFVLRPATSEDFSAIKKLIRLVDINPTGLDWRRFVIAVDASGRMLGCGQLKPHRGGILELASIAVEPAERHKGLASAIIDHLLSQAPRPLYLTCLLSMDPFYEKWGFRRLELNEMPAYFRRLVRLFSLMPGWDLGDDAFTVMKLM
jgi:N-acetylglutamate synthase-like GNAT family acetyltransferase